MLNHLGLLTLFLIATQSSASKAFAIEPSSSPFKSIKQFIIGGEEIEPTDPIAGMTVGIAMGKSICSGVILAKDIIITAAHCVHPDMKIVFGLNMRAPNTISIPVSHTAIPNGYVPNDLEYSSEYNQNDIALLHFTSELPNGYSPVTLLPENVNARNGQEVTIAGYGRTNPYERSPRILHKANVEVLDSEYSQTEAKLDKSSGRGSCKGDSGGPAFVRSGRQYYLWAIGNRGDRDCSRYAIYARITPHLNWIEEATGELRLSSSSKLP